MSGSCGEKEYPQKHTVRRPRMSKKNVQKKERTLPTVERTIMNKRATRASCSATRRTRPRA